MVTKSGGADLVGGQTIDVMLVVDGGIKLLPTNLIDGQTVSIAFIIDGWVDFRGPSQMSMGRGLAPRPVSAGGEQGA